MLHMGMDYIYIIIWHQGEFCILFLVTQEDLDVNYSLSNHSLIFEGFSLWYYSNSAIFTSIHYVRALFLWPLWNWQEGTITVHYYLTPIVTCNGRRDYRGNDLRDRLDGRRSPHRKYSPEREGRGHHAYHGYSSSRSIEEKSDRKRRKKQLLDGRSDFSGGLKISDGTDDRAKELKISSDSKDVYAEQLKQVQSDIDVLEDHKCQLEMYLEEKSQEADSLTNKIQELESQLYKEKEECKRLTSKIKKFVKAHNRHSRLNDELKRSQARLDKLGDHLVLDITKVGAFEEDSSINIVSDEDTTGNHVTSPRYQLQDNTSPSKKKSRINLNASKDSKSANLTNGEGYAAETTIRSERRSRWTEVAKNGNDGKRKRRNNVPSTDKVKGLEMGIVLPSTSMAAHAVDESIEADEVGGYKVGGVELPLPPPPPLPKNATYLQQYENVDVEGLEEEAVDVDIV